jgi:hypothetical protein
MSKEDVAQACGVPDGLMWRPPDYREQSLRYFFNYPDIDAPGCSGPSYVYGSQLVLFSWDGEVVSVLAGATAATALVDGHALAGCGPMTIASELTRAVGAGRAKAALANYGSHVTWPQHEVAREAVRYVRGE